MMVKFSKTDHQKSIQYMNTWFWDFETLASASNLVPDALNQMIRAGCAPGSIYAFEQDSGWWSALAAFTKKAPPSPNTGSQIWYSPGAVWWLRRTSLLLKSGLDIYGVALANRKSFVQEFIALLPAISNAKLAYPNCFKRNLNIDAENAAKVANGEWNAWISGAYGVCLRDFSANTCIRKEALGTFIRLHNEEPDKYKQNDIELLEMTQELASLVTPFSPWERPIGTPGKTIDVVLRRLGLGHDYPYPASQAVDTIV